MTINLRFRIYVIVEKTSVLSVIVWILGIPYLAGNIMQHYSNIMDTYVARL